MNTDGYWFVVETFERATFRYRWRIMRNLATYVRHRGLPRLYTFVNSMLPRTIGACDDMRCHRGISVSNFDHRKPRVCVDISYCGHTIKGMMTGRIPDSREHCWACAIPIREVGACALRICMGWMEVYTNHDKPAGCNVPHVLAELPKATSSFLPL